MADQNILIKFSADTQDATQDVQKFNQTLEGTETATNDVNKATQSLRSQLRGMQQELAQMAVAGKQNTAEYKALRDEAGKLADSISDARREIATAGSDTRGLDKAIRATTVLVGGFTALQGATALFGKQGEELQKTLVKINAAMSILQGLQAIQNELTQKDSILTAAATKAKALYAVAVGNGTKAMKLFRLALVSTGIGALVVVLGTVIANWDRLSKTIVNSFPALAKVGQFFRDFQFYMVATAKSAVALFRVLGDAFAIFLRDPKGAFQAIKDIPSEMREAFDKGFLEAKKAAQESEEVEQAGTIVGKKMGKAAGDAFVESFKQRLERLRQESQMGRTIQGQGGIGSTFFGGAFEDVTITPGAGRTGQRGGDSTAGLDKRKEDEKEYLSYLLDSLNAVAQLTDMISSARTARFEAAISDLERLKEAELENARLTAEQKERIEERYQKRIAKLKNEQARAQRRADLTQAIINTALAVAQNAANPIRAAIAAALGAAQIAIIARQPLPKFEKGGEVKGARHRSGGVHIEAEGGEWVMNRNAVTKYGKDVMKQINDLAMPKALLMPDLPAAVIAGVPHGIDHERLGKTISRELAKQPKVSIALDERGFSKFVHEGNRMRNYANRKFNAG